MVGPWLWHWLFGSQTRREALAGYITETSQIEAEYRTFTGKSVDPAAVAQFDRATDLMLQGNYGSATIILETAARQIPVPAVFNDLGLLYAKLKDGPHALRAYRDALARDHDYAPVRANLKKMSRNESADAGTAELEPNNDNSQANAVWLEKPVQAAISPSVGDIDSFWFITPRPPRDRVSISAVNQSSTLIPRLRIYDQNENLVTGLKEAPSAGASVKFDFSPPPNTLYYVQVDGVSGTSGAYALSVTALRAYDAYEPNDTILTATRIVSGQDVDANIMDGDDTDFYSFVSSTGGAVSIEVVPHNQTLELGLGMFAPDLHSVGFVPDPKSPGDPIHQKMQVEPNQRYYLQIFSKHDSTGSYSLVLK